MTRNELLEELDRLSSLRLHLPDGREIPHHFHITEAGVSTKQFIDCGGTAREEKSITLQVWVADDYDHRLAPATLSGILEKTEIFTGHQDLDVEIEYETDTLGRYGIEKARDGESLKLTPKKAECLAEDLCGISGSQPTERRGGGECVPGGGCC